MKFAKFFQDKRGSWAIIQPPNILLNVWVVLMISNMFLQMQPIRLLQGAVLFTWAYLELTDGDSNFRQALGAAVLFGIIASFFKL